MMLVYDGGGFVSIPGNMGTPSADQMIGTELEQLGELACRICYDSLGNGRSSEALHKHILEVQNLSVYEHCNFTVVLPNLHERHLLGCLNRKGIWVEFNNGRIEITANFRAVLEWDKYTTTLSNSWGFRLILNAAGYQCAPQIFPRSTSDKFEFKDNDALSPDQAWVSLHLYGSRGFTHEQVRHRFAMSQRSTRYVDESQSPYLEHPLVTQFFKSNYDPQAKERVGRAIQESIAADRESYNLVNQHLSHYLLERAASQPLSQGLSKTDARKQARGAARGYLGNALASEMIFSAPVSGWRHMLNMRASKFADAEIRLIYNRVLPALKASRYGHYFNDYELIDSPDGIGKVLA